MAFEILQEVRYCRKIKEVRNKTIASQGMYTTNWFESWSYNEDFVYVKKTTMTMNWSNGLVMTMSLRAAIFEEDSSANNIFGGEALYLMGAQKSVAPSA